MVCSRCRKNIAEGVSRCPHCGAAAEGASGMFQTSTVLISADGADLVYRSVAEVPAPLRTLLLKSTNGANSATILIADRRGRREISKAMRKLPGPAQRRLARAILGEEGGENGWLTPHRRKALAGLILALALALIAFAFSHRWS